MGLLLSLVSADFSIPIARTHEVLSVLVPFYEGIYRPKQTPRTLEEVFDDLAWPLVRAEDHWVMVDNQAPNFGWQDELFTTVAPFVVDGSYIEARREDGHLFEWRFVGGACRTSSAPERPDRERKRHRPPPSESPGAGELAANTDVPRALRAMQLAMSQEEWLTRALEARHLAWVDPNLDGTANLYGLPPESFAVFGGMAGGGHVALWRREPKAPIAECPVVIFGADGMVSVYARDFTGFLVLLSHGYALDVAASNGIRFDDELTLDNSITRMGRVTLASQLLTVDEALFAEMQRWEPAIVKRDAAEELFAGAGMLPRYLYAELADRNP